MTSHARALRFPATFCLRSSIADGSAAMYICMYIYTHTHIYIRR